MTTIKLRIVTPESTFYEDDIDMVTLPGVDGEMGFLPHHIRMMTQMVPGELVVRKGGRDQFLAVGEGLVEVSSDRVDIITDIRPLPRKTSTKPRPNKRVNALPPACVNGSLPKK